MNCKLFLSFIVVSIVLFFSSLDVRAQRIKPNRWFISADGGISVFFGDVKRYDYIPDMESPSEIQPMFSFNIGKELSPIINIRTQFLYGNVCGHKQSAKYNFKATTYGAHLMADFNLIYLLTKQRFGDSRFNVNVGLGIGYLLWDSKLYYDDPLADGTDLMGESNIGAISIPGALNVEYLITKNLSVGLTGNLFVVTSDEVDAKAGGIKVDMINYNSLGLVYRFKSNGKASRKNVKYRLDPSLYEPLERDKPVESAVVETEVIEEVLPIETAVVVNEVFDVDKEEKSVEEVVVVEKPKEFRINHELEKEAIEKETWASRGDDVWPGIKFSVQIAATKIAHDKEELKEEFGVKNTVYEQYDGTWYRYSVGQYDKMWRAKELRNTVRSVNGIEDAFIVVYRDNERISLAEALNYAARTQSVVLVKEEEVVKDEDMEKVYPLIRLDQSIPSEGILLGVQILSVRNDHYPLGVFSGIYGIEKNILINVKSPWHKLIAVGFEDYNDALDYQEYARSKGFIDAFVVAFKDGERISIATLKSLSNGQ